MGLNLAIFWKYLSISIIIFRLIWNQTDIRLVPNQSESDTYNLIHGKYNLISVGFIKFPEIFRKYFRWFAAVVPIVGAAACAGVKQISFIWSIVEFSNLLCEWARKRLNLLPYSCLIWGKQPRWSALFPSFSLLFLSFFSFLNFLLPNLVRFWSTLKPPEPAFFLQHFLLFTFFFFKISCLSSVFLFFFNFLAFLFACFLPFSFFSLNFLAFLFFFRFLFFFNFLAFSFSFFNIYIFFSCLPFSFFF